MWCHSVAVYGITDVGDLCSCGSWGAMTEFGGASWTVIGSDCYFIDW